MKRLIIGTIILALLPLFMTAQPVKGVIYADTTNILVVKVWGTHQERGYALGYLTGDRITDIIMNYIKPQFSVYYNMARNIIIQANDLLIAPEYHAEAQAIIDGMNAAGLNTANLDKTDVLVGNTFLDISNVLMMNSGAHCSALMSWNDATSGTDLDGKSVISRHVDWQYSAVLNRNHAIVVHFPQEPDESKWLLMGFSGMMSILSGFNPDFGAFQNMMDDFTGFGQHNVHYNPVWFALRDAIEAADYNGDGSRDVQDVRSALAASTQGFADGFIVSAMARSNPADSLAAMVAELASSAPMQVYRYSNFPDSIPGDNLYTANYQIARNNMMHFCPRYNNIRSNIGNGTGIGLDANWELMRDYSHLSTNTQFMQFAPELDYFRVSVYRDGKPAYQNEPVVFDLNDLFDNPATGTGHREVTRHVRCHPNPADETIVFSFTCTHPARVEIFDASGNLAREIPSYKSGVSVNITGLNPGLYITRIITREETISGKFMKH
jgi:hypothetical protein